MKKIRAAVVGYGNIGKFTLEALEAAPDFEVAGIVRRHGAENKPAELADYPVVKDIKELKDVDVAILATPTRSVEAYAKEILALGINTVDSFDIHTQIHSCKSTTFQTNWSNIMIFPIAIKLLYTIPDRIGITIRNATIPFCAIYHDARIDDKF